MEVYKINNIKMQNNTYYVDREEYWDVVLDATFKTMAEAKKYIIHMNKLHSDLLLNTLHMDETEKNKYILRFCFSDDCCMTRKYWLGKPNIKLIKEQLHNIGIKTGSFS
jgi:hypothetical protein